MPDDDETGDSVTASVELTGDYDEIAAILGKEEEVRPELDAVGDDMEAILEIVQRTGGTTKSQLVDQLPAGVTAEFDADSVIHALRVLELYDLVTLDGNTWRPGPALTPE